MLLSKWNLIIQVRVLLFCSQASNLNKVTVWLVKVRFWSLLFVGSAHETTRLEQF